MQKILETIREYHMIREGAHVLAGVSGGADSVCLLYALKEYQKECSFTLSAVHVEHGIRGAESREDAAFTQALCAGLGVACCLRACDVPAEARRRRQSEEETARILRYEIFQETARELGSDTIAVAHNENDVAETVLWNLVRGSGLKGLGGIRPVRDGIIRPLLFTPRAEIERILGERGIGYRTDRTNFQLEYTRNRLRLEVLPYLEQHLNRQAIRHLAGAADQLREASDYIDGQVQAAAQRCIRQTDGTVLLELEPFAAEEEFLKGELLRECLRCCRGGLKNVGRVHIEQLRRLAEMPSGKCLDLPGRIRAERRRGQIVFARQDGGSAGAKKGDAALRCGKRNDGSGAAYCTDEDSVCIPIDGGGVWELDGMRLSARVLEPGCGESRDSFDFNKISNEILTEKKYTKWLSCDTIKSNVCFRKRRSGDYLIINKEGGRRKLADYLIDQKVPRAERSRIWLAADGSHVLWVVGYRISEAAKVTEETEKILKITVKIQTEEDAV